MGSESAAGASGGSAAGAGKPQTYRHRTAGAYVAEPMQSVTVGYLSFFWGGFIPDWLRPHHQPLGGCG